MLSLRKPSEADVRSFLDRQRQLTFSYREVGASRRGAPPGYSVEHNRVGLGRGRETFERAVGALERWEMFDLGWARILPECSPTEVGTTVCVLARHLGFYSLNAARIVYTVEEDDGPVRRRGFAYGTLPGHAQRGEERFTVEWHREDDSVHYDLYSFARGNGVLVRAGYPVRRMLQKQFAEGSRKAMARAVRGEPEY